VDIENDTEQRSGPEHPISSAWLMAGLTGALMIMCGVFASMYFGLPVYPFLGTYKTIPPMRVKAGLGTKFGFSVGWAGKWNAKFYREDSEDIFEGELNGKIEVNGKVILDNIAVTDGSEFSVPVELKRGNRVMLHVHASGDMSGEGFCTFEVPKRTPSPVIITIGKVSTLFFLFVGFIIDVFFLAYYVRRRQVLTAIERVSARYRSAD
jgi:hypothetical protein